MWRISRLFGRGCLDGKSDCDNLTIGEIIHLEADLSEKYSKDIVLYILV